MGTPGVSAATLSALDERSIGSRRLRGAPRPLPARRRFSSRRCSEQLWSGPRCPQPTIEANDADENFLVIDGAERRQWIKGARSCSIRLRFWTQSFYATLTDAWSSRHPAAVVASPHAVQSGLCAVSGLRYAGPMAPREAQAARLGLFNHSALSDLDEHILHGPHARRVSPARAPLETSACALTRYLMRNSVPDCAFKTERPRRAPAPHRRQAHRFSIVKFSIVESPE
jgi:hypothetical protein